MRCFALRREVIIGAVLVQWTIFELILCLWLLNLESWSHPKYLFCSSLHFFLPSAVFNCNSGEFLDLWTQVNESWEMLQEVQSNVHPESLEFVNVSSCEPHLYTHTQQIDLHWLLCKIFYFVSHNKCSGIYSNVTCIACKFYLENWNLTMYFGRIYISYSLEMCD